ncbi:MAG: hypothetical protein E6R03_10630 [Hyphomicrobiaceae bacterium]|nr:MAG: hypothetical protein E6R03_10630 [Hyphomicrobiaceae bacterium]
MEDRDLENQINVRLDDWTSKSAVAGSSPAGRAGLFQRRAVLTMPISLRMVSLPTPSLRRLMAYFLQNARSMCSGRRGENDGAVIPVFIIKKIHRREWAGVMRLCIA